MTDPRKVTKVVEGFQKVDSDIHPDLNKFTANIQNIYIKPDGGTVNGVPYYAHLMSILQKEIMVGEKHVPFFHDTIDPIEGQNKVYVASSSLPFTGVLS